MADTKFSQFAVGGAQLPTDIVVGLRGGVNTQFTSTNFFTENTVYIAKNGNDTTGDGSISNPFQTLAGMYAKITDNSSSKIYSVLDFRSQATETNIAIKPFINLIGNFTELTFNTISLDASWGTSNQSVNIEGYIFNSAITSFILNLSTAGANTYNIFFVDCYFSGPATFIGKDTNTVFGFSDTLSLAGMASGACNFSNCVGAWLSGTVPEVAVTATSPTFIIFLGGIANGNISATSAANQIVLLFSALHTVANSPTLTLDGAAVSAIIDSSTLSATFIPTLLNSATFTISSALQSIGGAGFTPTNYTLGTPPAGYPVSLIQHLEGINNALAGSGGITWTEVTVNTPLVANNGYIANSGSQLIFTLPVTAAIGDTFVIVGKGSGGWRVEQQGGQSTHLGQFVTTTGITGALESTNQFDSLTITCITANTEFTAYQVTGNITYL